MSEQSSTITYFVNIAKLSIIHDYNFLFPLVVDCWSDGACKSPDSDRDARSVVGNVSGVALVADCN